MAGSHARKGTRTPSPSPVRGIRARTPASIAGGTPGSDMTAPSPAKLEDQVADYVHQCSTRDAEPILEVVVALKDPKVAKVNLSARRQPLTATDGTCLAEAVVRNKSIRELNLAMNELGGSGAAEIAVALEENKYLCSVSLAENAIGDEGALALAGSLVDNHSLSTLNLRNNSITNNGAIELAESIAGNTRLSVLDLQRNNIECEGGIAFAAALKVNSCMTVLNMRFNELGDAAATAIGQSLELNEILKELDLGGNKIGPQGGVALANGLANNRALSQMNMRSNKIGDRGATAFGEALTLNSSLKELYLGSNEIAKDGVIAIASSWEKNGSLEKLDLQNASLGNEAVMAIADALRLNCTIRELILQMEDNQKMDECDVKAISNAVRSNTSISELSLGDVSHVDPEVVAVITNTLNVNKYISGMEGGARSPSVRGRSSPAKSPTPSPFLSRRDLKTGPGTTAGEENDEPELTGILHVMSDQIKSLQQEVRREHSLRLENQGSHNGSQMGSQMGASYVSQAAHIMQGAQAAMNSTLNASTTSVEDYLPPTKSMQTQRGQTPVQGNTPILGASRGQTPILGNTPILGPSDSQSVLNGDFDLAGQLKHQEEQVIGSIKEIDGHIKELGVTLERSVTAKVEETGSRISESLRTESRMGMDRHDAEIRSIRDDLRDLQRNVSRTLDDMAARLRKADDNPPSDPVARRMCEELTRKVVAVESKSAASAEGQKALRDEWKKDIEAAVGDQVKITQEHQALFQDLAGAVEDLQRTITDNKAASEARSNKVETTLMETLHTELEGVARKLPDSTIMEKMELKLSEYSERLSALEATRGEAYSQGAHDSSRVDALSAKVEALAATVENMQSGGSGGGQTVDDSTLDMIEQRLADKATEMVTAWSERMRREHISTLEAHEAEFKRARESKIQEYDGIMQTIRNLSRSATSDEVVRSVSQLNERVSALHTSFLKGDTLKVMIAGDSAAGGQATATAAARDEAIISALHSDYTARMDEMYRRLREELDKPMPAGNNVDVADVRQMAIENRDNISKLADELKWLDDESIRLRVEDEAKMKQQAEGIRTFVMQQHKVLTSQLQDQLDSTLEDATKVMASSRNTNNPSSPLSPQQSLKLHKRLEELASSMRGLESIVNQSVVREGPGVDDDVLRKLEESIVRETEEVKKETSHQLKNIEHRNRVDVTAMEKALYQLSKRMNDVEATVKEEQETSLRALEAIYSVTK